MAPPAADLVIIFRARANTKQEALEAENQYSTLIQALRKAGLKATGRKGIKDGQVIILVRTPDDVLAQLVQSERYRDFVNGVPSYNLPSVARNYTADPLTPAERVRLTYSLVTTSPVDQGLGISDKVPQWSRVKEVIALHDYESNEKWIKAWTKHKKGISFSENDLDQVKDQFGEQIGLYFAFVSSYAQALIFPAAVGAGFWYFDSPYHPAYSVLLCLWAVVFVESWRIKEKALGVRWGSYGVAKVELRRSQFVGANDSSETQADDSSFPWWKREGRIVAGLPVVGFFAAALVALLTTIFVIEAFVTQLYTGPGVKYVSLGPTILFMLSVPRLVGLYQSYAVKLTDWENHVHEGVYEASLAHKTFGISSIVAYGGLFLSTFVYIPFGEQILQVVQQTFFTSPTAASSNETDQKLAALTDAKRILNPDRLKGQVFAYLITNQIVGEILELGVPMVTRFFGKSTDNLAAKSDLAKKGLKKVGWGDEKAKLAALDDGSSVSDEEKAFLEDVRKQVALPRYDVFGDYSEMVTQFGYCVSWSTCWSLAPVGALVNNWMEIRGDAVKIAHYARRPIPRRTDSIGPWLDILTFLAWQGALINSALVFLFYGGTTDPKIDATFIAEPLSDSFVRTLQSAILPAVLIALSSSHAFILVCALVKHILVRALWRGSEADIKLNKCERDVKRLWLSEVGGGAKIVGSGGLESEKRALEGATGGATADAPRSFWEDDQGLAEIRRDSKEL